jgi:hypothetical protein
MGVREARRSHYWAQIISAFTAAFTVLNIANP